MKNYRGTGKTIIKNLLAAVGLIALALPLSAAPVPKAWTVMIFMNAKNELDQNSVNDIREMESVGSTQDMNVVLEAGRVKWEDTPAPNKKVRSLSRRYLLSRNIGAGISSKPLMEIQNADMGSWEHLVEFMAWSKKNFPAKRYMLIVWGHGTGWRSYGKQLTSSKSNLFFRSRGISYDDESGNHITSTEMGWALAKERTDVYVSDSCFMQDIAVDYEIKGYTGVIVGSQEVTPKTGYNYSLLLANIALNTQASTQQVGALVAQSMKDEYEESGITALNSALDATAIDNFIPLLDAFTKAIETAKEVPLAKTIAKKTIYFTNKENKDLGNFVMLMAENTKDKRVMESAAALIRYMRENLIIRAVTTNTAYNKAVGLSIYFPQYEDPSFEVLKFSRASAWYEFSKKLIPLPTDPDYYDF